MLVHFIEDFDRYKKSLYDWTEVIQQDLRDFIKEAKCAGFDDRMADEIGSFLENSRKDLDPERIISTTMNDHLGRR